MIRRFVSVAVTFLFTTTVQLVEVTCEFNLCNIV